MRTDSATPALGGSRIRNRASAPPGVLVFKWWIHVGPDAASPTPAAPSRAPRPATPRPGIGAPRP
jgi:hypothetical protein